MHMMCICVCVCYTKLLIASITELIFSLYSLHTFSTLFLHTVSHFDKLSVLVNIDTYLVLPSSFVLLGCDILGGYDSQSQGGC
jgi:hypothetical protein